MSLDLAEQRREIEDVQPTVGDWLLLDSATGKLVRVLDRSSAFERVRPGSKADVQTIAANVDTAFIVTACNEEFKLSRLERYLALAREAGAEPVVVLTKADLCEEPETYIGMVRGNDPRVSVYAVNALDHSSLNELLQWLGEGDTVSLLGSSGTGKSTLLNTISESAVQATGSVRESDQHGRHTTTSRSLHVLARGGIVIDSPGMRELQLAGAEDGLAETFDDVEALASRCRFHDCSHTAEPGCAVLAAVQHAELDERRLRNYRKLMAEQARHAETLAEPRHRSRALGKLYRRVQAAKRDAKKER